MARLSYLELPVRDAAASSRFYQEAFGWEFTEFGPTYAATVTGDTDVGLQADPAQGTAAALPVIKVAGPETGPETGLEDALAAVERAGGEVTAPIFAFPGGRRFHFRDPDGHELAVMEVDRA